MPLTEDMPIGGCLNPYGWTKCMIEQILFDVAKAESDWTMVLLRYFNPWARTKAAASAKIPTASPTI